MLAIPVLDASLASFWLEPVPHISVLSVGLMSLCSLPQLATCSSDSELSFLTHPCLWVRFYLSMPLIPQAFSGLSPPTLWWPVLSKFQCASFGSWNSNRMNLKFNPVGPPWFMPISFITPLWIFSCEPRAQPTYTQLWKFSQKLLHRIE